MNAAISSSDHDVRATRIDMSKYLHLEIASRFARVVLNMNATLIQKLNYSLLATTRSPASGSWVEKQVCRVCSHCPMLQCA
jgi:hypothetical protein